LYSAGRENILLVRQSDQKTTANRRNNMGIGAMEWLLIFLIVLLLFGAKRLPEIARSLGKATQEFRKAKNEIVNSVDDSANAAKPNNDTAKSAETPAKDGDQPPKQGA